MKYNVNSARVATQFEPVPLAYLSLLAIEQGRSGIHVFVCVHVGEAPVPLLHC